MSKTVISACIAILLVSPAVLVARADDQAAAATPSRSPLLIVGFESAPQTEPRDAWIPVAFEEFLTWRLRRVPSLDVTPTVRAYQAWRDLADSPDSRPDWPRVGRALGTGRWVRGVCSGTEDALTVDLTIAATTEVDSSDRTVKLGPDRLPQVLNEATRWLLEQTGAGELNEATRTLVLSPPSESAGAIEYYARAVAAVRAERTRDAVRFAEQAVSYDTNMRPAQLLLAQLELHISDRGRVNAATRLRQLRELARRAGDRLDLAQIELTEGLVLAGKQAFESAAMRFETALNWSRECDEVYTQLAAMTNLCDSHLSRQPPRDEEMSEQARRDFLLEHLRHAAQWQERVLATLGELGDVVSQAPAANKLALIYERLGEPERALQMHELTLRAAQACGSRRTQATGWMFLGQFYRMQGRASDALDATRRCLELADDDARAGVLIAMADIFREMGESTQALEQYEQANRFLGRSEDLLQQMLCLRRIAVLRRELGDRTAALAALQEAYDIAHALRLPERDLIEKQLAEWKAGAP